MTTPDAIPAKDVTDSVTRTATSPRPVRYVAQARHIESGNWFIFIKEYGQTESDPNEGYETAQDAYDDVLASKLCDEPTIQTFQLNGEPTREIDWDRLFRKVDVLSAQQELALKTEIEAQQKGSPDA